MNEIVRPKVYPGTERFERKDWHAWKFTEFENDHEGPGEDGKGVKQMKPANRNYTKRETFLN